MESSKPHPAIKPTIIEPTRGWIKLKLGEVFEYHELVGLLAWRDVAVRYKQTLVGTAWAIVQPLAMMGLSSVVFRRWVHMPSDGVPYPLFTFVALLPWLYFSNAMAACAGSLIKSSSILTKVYFPRLIIPVASILPPLVDFCIGLVLLVIMLFCYGIVPTWRLIAVPFLLALTMLLSLTVGIWLSALSVRFRDLSHLVPFMTQMWMFASPIVYPGDLVSWRWRSIYVLNPMAAIIETFRWAILGTQSNLHFDIFTATLITIALFLAGVAYFQYIERSIADYI